MATPAQWRKLGRIVDPAGAASWMQSHAALPVAVHRDGDVFRVYCAGRDGRGRGQVGWADIMLGESPKLLEVGPEPLLTVGELGTFDDSGALPAAVVRDGDRSLLYYTGVTLGQTVPFYYAVGVAESEDGGQTWKKRSAAPLLDRNDVDPLLTASPAVLRDGPKFRMWYTSGVRWSMEEGAAKHYYHLRYAESDDGIAWRRDGRVAIDFKPGEYAISRPCVLRDADCYRMWYAYRGAAYRIGYAESDDGLTWIRKDESAGIEPSAEGWDSEMICYPFVFNHRGSRYMLYNGNGYGRSGFGLAVAT